MPQRAPLGFKRKIYLTFLVLALILITLAPITGVIAVNEWQEDDEPTQTSIISKPVDPVFINVPGVVDVYGQPEYRENISIPVPLGESWNIIYSLEQGKRYHVFLVGDWVSNNTNPRTDYDILTVYPDEDVPPRWNTESAGLPEQVAFDDYHHYFVPPESGDYQFEIINDDRDSIDSEPAIFMVIENIDLNTGYSRYLKGRSPSGGGVYEEVEQTSWAYEFNSQAQKIRVFVDVPDWDHEPERGDLDMYEVRLYAMANPEAGVGNSVDGIGVPSGSLFDNFAGEYGGYNSSCNGDRNVEAMASCEYPGADMAFTYDTPNGENGTNYISYFLVLIAEHGEGIVNFYVQTDFISPNITLVNPPSIGYAGEKTRVTVELEEEFGIDRVWMEYVIDGETFPEVGLSKNGDLWIGDLPEFSVLDFVNYTVYAEDEFDNIGEIESSFLVKERVTIQNSLADSTLRTGQPAELMGTSSLDSDVIELVFNYGDFSESVNVSTSESGAFSYTYYAKQPGDWSVQAFYHGDDLHYPSQSEPFRFTKSPVTLTCSLYEISIRGTQRAEVRGTSSLTSAPIELEFTSGSKKHVYDLYTDESGRFNFEFSPDALGEWSLKAIFNEDEYESTASSEAVTFRYESLTTHISALLNPSSVKVGRSISISGSVAPQVDGLPVEMLFVTASSSHTETIFTDLRGSFSFDFTPEEVDTWNVLSKVGDGLIYSKTSKLLEFEVLPLNFFDKVVNVGLMMLSPPYSYGAVGLVFVGFSSVLYVKRDSVVKLLPKSLAKKFTGKKSKKKKKSKNGAKRYRRNG
jgi:hypothetical protein